MPYPRNLIRLLFAASIVLGVLFLAATTERQPTDSQVVGKGPAGSFTPLPLAVDAGVPVASPPALFSFDRPADQATLDRLLPAPSREVYYVRLNTAVFDGKHSPFWQEAGAGKIEVPLPDGGRLTVVIEESEMLGADRYTSVGRIEGRPLSRAIFAYNQGYLHAAFEDPLLGSFALQAATEELSQFYQVDPELAGSCGGERRPAPEDAGPVPAAAPRAAQGGAGLTGELLAAPIAAAVNPQRAEVHVLMVHTQAVMPTLSGAARSAAVQSAFDLAISRVNVALAASEITARVRLVGVRETQYASDGSAGGSAPNFQNTALDALYRTGDGQMDEIHAMRDQLGADIVCLALNRSDTSSTGIGFLLAEPGKNTNAAYAFSVVQYSRITGTNLVPHEFGHNLGCAHDRPNSVSGQGAYGYSYGYTFLAADGRQYRDIMAYPPGIELGYFSNPRMSAPAPAPANTPGGVAAGSPGESDTALTIEQNAFEVANFRLQTQAAPNVGALINVSTLAYSGPGAQVLIGGFVVQGTQPKRMLLRGAGPALADFGVADFLVDPQLRIFSGADEIGFNDNWSESPHAGDVGFAALQSGAFAFAPGSRDAALLVTLSPGAYTAFVEGANGTTGRGLIEAYDVDRGGNKIVNLSTRGYADNQGREMIGGFVVEGDPGTTKRILVRVLGPSLERDFNLAGAMFDPYMELRDGQGALLIKNDDWSTGSDRVGGVADDFRPHVRYYGEQQIAATGWAPGNRREPCVMVDLPPGSYTVIVKPFELRSSNPNLDQPARPGLGIVEVYEVNP